MDAFISLSALNGVARVPGSKSHTIRACILAALAEGTSIIHNPLASEDCLSCVRVIKQFGAEASLEPQTWTIHGAGSAFHLPDNVVDVGNSGSVLYFMAPIASTLEGSVVFTGDDSIRTRPVRMMLDALGQLGANGVVTRPRRDAPPFLISGPASPGSVVTSGKPSQYVSGILMAASRVNGAISIQLTDPKETPYLQMTIDWLSSLGLKVNASADYRNLSVTGPARFNAFTKTIPADWEAAAFPLIAAAITDSELNIADIDCSGEQGDQKIADILKEMGADISLFPDRGELIIRGCEKSTRPAACGEHKGCLRGLEIDCADIPDAVPALAAIACFACGETRLTDVGVCRLKETDRVALLETELKKLGVLAASGEDYLVIKGAANPGENPLAAGRRLKGARLNSRGDHRAAMAFSCMGMAIAGVSVSDAESCAVSFPNFFDVMKSAGAAFTLKTES